MQMEKWHEFAVPVKLCVFLCTILGVFLTTDKNNLWMLGAAALLYVAVQRQWRQLLGLSIFYGVLSLLLYLIRYHGLKMVIFTEFHVFMFWWLAPIFIAAFSLISTPPGKLSAFFSRVKAPVGVTLGMLVVFRFFPTMKSELKGLRESMHNRGLTTGAQVIAHPAATFEYMLVPTLMRCLQISDQLSVSAVSRGIEAPGQRQSYHSADMHVRDYACTIVYIALTVAFLTFGRLAA